MPAGDVIEQPDRPWNRGLLRRTNERLLLDRLRALGTASRAQLARETGLSKPTVSTALASLAAAGLVHEVGTLTPERGRTAVLYAPDPAAGYVLGVDIGRTWLRVAVVDLDGAVAARADVRNRARTSTALAGLVVDTARRVIADAALDPAAVVHGVVGTPGVYDPARRRVRYAAHLPGWGRAGIVDRLGEELGMPLEVHNDANLAALGEYTYGAGAGSRLLAYLLIGTGLGMGVVAEGRLCTGAHGLAGEIGFLPWPGGPKPERLEDAVSGVAVVAAARRFGMSGRLTAKAVFDAARLGVPAAVRAVELEAERVAYTVAAAAAVLDPDLIVLGGGVGQGVDLLLGPVREHLRALTPLRPRIAPSRLGEDAVLLGAVATALDTARDLVFEHRTAGT
ncbi:ROK family protein [Streptomyces sp. LP11]|uniref:ROK family protein n=1 Tax=Streptomyces pyxinicus TaxID=2970331 RepID=A0ABT2B5I3_9ACTN|nr:ROK family protein [Streptomyces sp. LP11]MCS0603772.1 ROK family protein [Streptomyces sp. LP11]